MNTIKATFERAYKRVDPHIQGTIKMGGVYGGYQRDVNAQYPEINISLITAMSPSAYYSIGDIKNGFAMDFYGVGKTTKVSVNVMDIRSFGRLLASDDVTALERLQCMTKTYCNPKCRGPLWHYNDKHTDLQTKIIETRNVHKILKTYGTKLRFIARHGGEHRVPGIISQVQFWFKLAHGGEPSRNLGSMYSDMPKDLTKVELLSSWVFDIASEVPETPSDSHNFLIDKLIHNVVTDYE